MHEPELRRLRDSIDVVDQQILLLLAERLRLVLEVGELKRLNKVDVYDPERERSMLDRIARSAPAPLDGSTARRIFEHVIKEYRGAEQVSVDSYRPAPPSKPPTK
jgi:3-deoxy-7-phosphoheptulonate synthase / chorismate mutase